MRSLLSAAVLFQFTTCTANQYGSYGTLSIGGGGLGANFTWNNTATGVGRVGIPAYGQAFQSGPAPTSYAFGANP